MCDKLHQYLKDHLRICTRDDAPTPYAKADRVVVSLELRDPDTKEWEEISWDTLPP